MYNINQTHKDQRVSSTIFFHYNTGGLQYIWQIKGAENDSKSLMETGNMFMPHNYVWAQILII